MYADKEKLAVRLYEILENTVVGGVNIDEVLTPSQRYDLVISIINGLPYSNQEIVKIINKEFENPVYNFEDREIGDISLLLTSAFNLFKSHNVDRDFVYNLVISEFNSVYNQESNYSDEDIIKLFLDNLIVSYNLLEERGLSSIIYEGMLELLNHKLSMLHNNIEEVKDTIKNYTKKEELETIKLNSNNKFKIVKKITRKVIGNPNNVIPFNIKDLIKSLTTKNN